MQSMTNTDTVDVRGDRRPGRRPAARRLRAGAHHRQQRGGARCRDPRGLDARGVKVPLVGDFHFNGHRLLAQYPECAQALPNTASIPAMFQR